MNGCLGEDTLKHVEKNGERWITIGVYDILFCCFPMGNKTCAEASEDGWIKKVCVLLE